MKTCSGHILSCMNCQSPICLYGRAAKSVSVTFFYGISPIQKCISPGYYGPISILMPFRMPCFHSPGASAALAGPESRWSRPRVLKQRMITAFILIPLAVWGVISLTTDTLSLVFAVVLAAGAWEWTALMGLSSLLSRVSYILLVILMLVLAAWTVMNSVMLY